MITKYSTFSGVGADGEPLLHIIDPGEKVKTASALLPEVDSFIRNLTPDPRYTYVLVNALGYSEYFGPNANKDWYGLNPNLNFNGLLHTPDNWGMDYEEDRKRGKAWAYGYPTFYGATVYAHHKNTDPKKFGFGDIIFVAANARMKRIELVKRIDNEEIRRKGRASILDRIRHGERVDTSMGCRVPFDLCSICTDWDTVQKAWDTFDPRKHLHPGIAVVRYHKTVKRIRGLSITKADNCVHMKTQAGKILPDGKRVFVYNDFPRFFDNSFVWIGADRTARVMWFLTPNTPTAADVEARKAAPRIVIRDRTFIMQAMNKVAGEPIKVSEMDKEIPNAIVRAVHTQGDCESPIKPAVLKSLQAEHGTDRLLSTLASLGIVLTPREFQEVAIPEASPLRSILAKRPALFSTQCPEVDDSLAISPANTFAPLANSLSELLTARSAYAPHIVRRITITQHIRKDPPVCATPELDKIAALYNGYRISVIEQAPKFAEQYVAQADIDAEDMLKVASVGVCPSFS